MNNGMTEVWEIIRRMETLLKEERRTEALAMLEELDTMETDELEVHRALANLAEELGAVSRQITELNLAVKTGDNPVQYLKELFDVHLDNGDDAKAEKCLERILDIDGMNVFALEKLARFREEKGDFGQASSFYRKAFVATGDEYFSNLASRADRMDSGGYEPEEDTFAEETAGTGIRDDDEEPGYFDSGPRLDSDRDVSVRNLVLFRTLFSGREDVYARQWISPTGKQGYTPVREPLTHQVLRDHFSGRITAGIYQMRLDNTVNFAALDLDITKFAYKQAIGNAPAWRRMMRKIDGVMKKYIDHGASQDIPLLCEDSGSKGRHVWIFFSEPVPARAAKMFINLFASQVMDIPPEISVEAFPKQAFLKSGGLGNLIKLPLGFHKKTGRRCLFLDPDGKPVKDQFGHLEGIAAITKKTVYDYINRYKLENRVVSGKYGTFLSDEHKGFDDRSGNAALSAPEPFDSGEIASGELAGLKSIKTDYSLENDEKFNYLISRCPVLRRIVENASLKGELSGDEKIVLIHTVGHLETGPMAVNAVFNKCINIREDEYMKSRLRGNPISCPKIRKHLKELCSEVGCRCDFSEFNTYPSPVLHLQSPSLPAGSISDPLGSLGFRNLVKDYLEARRKSIELREMLVKYGQEMKKYFEAAGVNEVMTPMGKLMMVESEGDDPKFRLEM